MAKRYSMQNPEITGKEIKTYKINILLFRTIAGAI